MAAQAWELYNSAIGALGSATLDLDAGANIYRMRLYKSDSNASTVTFVSAGSLTSEVANANGYATRGKTLSAHTWTSVASGTWRFDSTNVAWTASGGAITSVGFAVIAASNSILVCKSKLTTTGFISIGTGGTLTIQINASGIFELS